MESVTEQQCIHCGPVCYGGAAHNARAEGGVLFRDSAGLSREIDSGRHIGGRLDVVLSVLIPTTANVQHGTV